ncbi:sensor histidine kinase [Plebeiibacterium sediminum]|uniref:histidine kinase n=1 Tax=Plebeiibacterium sediminum TaxID=2992112 RepID=A0AAE3M9N1_9BACT|nr:histidine kinase [Plebeiobacterium sediminum]MCW3789145.1 histidine kinase [Plebeiobacterium sediminum]
MVTIPRSINGINRWFINNNILTKDIPTYKKSIIATYSTLIIYLLFIVYAVYFYIENPWSDVKNINNGVALVIFNIYFALMRFSKNVNIPLAFINLTILPVLYKSIIESGGYYSSDLGWILFTIITSNVFVTRWFGLLVTFISCMFLSWLYFFSDLDLSQPFTQNQYFSWLFLTILTESVISAFTHFLDKANHRILRLSEERIEELDREVKKITQRYSALRTELGRDFHDEMGNKLATIKLMSESLYRRLGDKVDQDINHDLTEIMNNSQNLLDGTRDFLWSIDWNNNTLNELYYYICDFSENILFKGNIQFIPKFNINEAEASHIYSPNFLRQILFLCKEVVTNSYKHSNASEFHFEMELKSSDLILKLSDNGSGFNLKEKTNSHGLKNIAHRVSKLGGEMQTQTHNACEYQFKIPVSSNVFTYFG